MKLICYYSYTCHTKALAYRVHEKYGYDMCEIKPVTPYSDDYDKVVSDAQEDVNMNYQPEIQEINVDLDKYDTIILMTPVWWYTVASPVNTFLHKFDLSGKTIIPVATNGGWLGHTFEDIKRITGANVINELSLKYDQDDLTEEEKFDSWLNKLEDNNG